MRSKTSFSRTEDDVAPTGPSLTEAPLYVALGDSMSIDLYAGGPGRGAAALLHRNRDADFPDWTGRDLTTLGYAALDLSYDGATTAGVVDRQLPRLDRRPDLVTLTVGGNDLMGAYGVDTAAEAVIRTVVERGETILGRVAAAFEGSPRVVVTTVYDPSDGTGAVPSGGLPPWPNGPRLVRALNAELSGLAGRHGAVVADVHARFLGHGASAGDPGQPHPRPDNRQLWYCGVIEPNAWGAHEIRCTWWAALDRAGWLTSS
jgi:lysophospholipase L1-like esterase